jgi:hypothetical protein
MSLHVYIWALNPYPVRLTAPWSLSLTWGHWERFQKRRRREWYRKILSNSYLGRWTFILWLPRQALKLMVSNLDRADRLDFRLYSTNNRGSSDMRTYSLHGWLPVVPLCSSNKDSYLPVLSNLYVDSSESLGFSHPWGYLPGPIEIDVWSIISSSSCNSNVRTVIIPKTFSEACCNHDCNEFLVSYLFTIGGHVSCII